MSSIPSFAFENSFSGYSFSFALLYNNNDLNYIKGDTTDSVSANAILNIPYTDASGNNVCFPFGNQFIIQPFGNSEAGYSSNNPNTAVLSESAFTAKSLSELFAAAFTPATFFFLYRDSKPRVQICYSYNCSNDISGNTCTSFLPPKVFTFEGDNAKTLAKSTSQVMEIPYWTSEQVNDTSGSCVPMIAKITVHLEADPFLQKVFPNLIYFADNTSRVIGTGSLPPIEGITVGKNFGVDDSPNSFPVFYLRVVIDDFTSSTLPKDASGNILSRPFFTSETQVNGIELNILTEYNPTTVYNGVPNTVVLNNNTIFPGTVQFSTLSNAAKQVTNTNSVGLLVFRNLQYSFNSSGTTNLVISNQKNLNLNLGTFPTTAGSKVIVDDTNTIYNGDVVIVESKNVAPQSVNDGTFLTFQYRQQNQNKVPSMAKQYGVSGYPTKNFLWQVVKLTSNGEIIGNVGDKITYDSYVGLYAYQCVNNDPNIPVTCGWMSASSCGTNCVPYMSNGHGTCEAWKIVNKQGNTGNAVVNKAFFGLEASANSTCAFPKGWLTNDNRAFTNPPTIFKSGNESGFQDGSSYWNFTKALPSPQPLPK